MILVGNINDDNLSAVCHSNKELAKFGDLWKFK